MSIVYASINNNKVSIAIRDQYKEDYNNDSKSLAYCKKMEDLINKFGYEKVRFDLDGMQKYLVQKYDNLSSEDKIKMDLSAFKSLITDFSYLDTRIEETLLWGLVNLLQLPITYYPIEPRIMHILLPKYLFDLNSYLDLDSNDYIAKWTVYSGRNIDLVKSLQKSINPILSLNVILLNSIMLPFMDNFNKMELFIIDPRNDNEYKKLKHYQMLNNEIINESQQRLFKIKHYFKSIFESLR